MPQTSGTVIKALSLLDEFLTGTDEIGLRELTKRTGIHKTTVMRLCASLTKAGLLERPNRTVYRLGPKAWQLGQAYSRSFRLEGIIRPILRRVREQTGESVSFYVIDGNERVCRFRENSQLVIRHHIDEGARMPLGSGVVGRVLLAFAGRKGADFDRIRRAGFLIAQGREADTTSVSVPVIDDQGRMHGGLVVSGPSLRFSGDKPKKALAMIKAAAAEIRSALPDLAMQR
jgi:DNA-binding IclR family transcriptional regulator